MTPAVLKKARSKTQTESRELPIQSVTHAESLPSGDLLVCFEIPKKSGEGRRTVSVEVPLSGLARLSDRSALDFGRDSGFDTATPGVLLELAPVLAVGSGVRTIPGQPAYWLALPFARAFDVFVASFYFMALRV